MPLAPLPTDVINDLTQCMCEETIIPFTSGGIQGPVEGILVHCLRVNHIRNTFDPIQAFQGGQKNLPSIRLSRARGTNHHETMLNLLNLVQLQNLVDPAFSLHQSTLSANLANLFAKGIKVDRHVFSTGEYISQQTEPQISKILPFKPNQ